MSALLCYGDIRVMRCNLYPEIINNMLLWPSDVWWLLIRSLAAWLWSRTAAPCPDLWPPPVSRGDGEWRLMRYLSPVYNHSSMILVPFFSSLLLLWSGETDVAASKGPFKGWREITRWWNLGEVSLRFIRSMNQSHLDLSATPWLMTYRLGSDWSRGHSSNLADTEFRDVHSCLDRWKPMEIP